MVILDQQIIVDLVCYLVYMKYSDINTNGEIKCDGSQIIIGIKRGLPKREEDIAILHEWVHAAHDLLNDTWGSEEEVERITAHLYENNYNLVGLIRSFYTEEGF